jgi:hypothetical protein
VGPLHGGGDDSAMAAMDAVEVADGDHRPVQPFNACAIVAHDDKRMSVGGFGHDESGVRRCVAVDSSTIR